MAELKLIQLNVEGDRHWDRIIPFLEREAPEVLCLQELFDHDAGMLAKRFGYHYAYIPIVKNPDNKGTALLTKLPLTNRKIAYYYRAAPELQTYGGDSVAEKRSTISQGIAWGDVEKEGVHFTIASNHFTWTPDGKPNGNQDVDLESLFKILDTIPTLLLCGDFNVPRGDNRIYRALAEHYKDNIPAEVKTTMDIALHRVKNDPLESAKLAAFVVDYIFSTPEYAVSDVRCEYGVSDHCAVIATVACEK